MSALVPTLRPANRVREYLLKEYSTEKADSPRKLPTVRQLAAHLNVSHATVHLVYKKLASEGHIHTQRGEGSFLNQNGHRPKNQSLQIAIDYNVPEKELRHYWFGNVYAGMLHSMIRESLRVNFFSMSDSPEESPDVVEKIRLGEIDGLLLLDKAYLKKLRDLVPLDDIPYAHLRAPDSSVTTNFVSPDYFQFAKLAGEAFMAAGRKKVLFITNLHLGHSEESSLMYSGLASGMDTHLDREATLRYFPVDMQGDEVDLALKKLASESYLPDAIFTLGETLAGMAMKSLMKRGMQVPEQVSVIASSAVDLIQTPWPKLTHVRHPFEDLGSTLLHMLIDRIEKNGVNLPGVYLHCDYQGGATTTAAENAVLGISAAEA